MRVVARGIVAHETSVRLLPAGKERNVRRSNLNNTKSLATQVGGHA